jgi:transcription elongation GreA/GreB family factor
MPNSLNQTVDETRRWPLTSEAWNQLIDEAARIRQDLSSMTGQGLEEGIVQLPVALAGRRLETLRNIMERAPLVDDIPCAAVGRRATLRDTDGETSHEIVLPGDGDPVRGCIAADSPVGRAILGARPGDAVEVTAPAGRWSVTVVAVE